MAFPNVTARRRRLEGRRSILFPVIPDTIVPPPEPVVEKPQVTLKMNSNGEGASAEIIECNCPDNGNEEHIVTFSSGENRKVESLSETVVSPIDFKEITINLNDDYPDLLTSGDEFTAYLVPAGTRGMEKSVLPTIAVAAHL